MKTFYLLLSFVVIFTLFWSFADSKVRKKFGCIVPREPVYGTFRFRRGDKSLKIVCEPGFIVVGTPEKIHCRRGKWNSYLFEKPFKMLDFRDNCTEPFGSIRKCPPLKAPKNGVVITHSREVDGKAVFRCDTGYIIEGSEERICFPGRIWGGEQPVCRRLQTIGDMANLIEDKLISKLSSASATSEDGAIQSKLAVGKSGLDIIFALDVSASIGAKSLDTAKDFIKLLVKEFGVSPRKDGGKNGTRVALLTFSSDTEIVFDLDDGKVRSQEKVFEELDKIKGQKGGTNFAHLLQKINDIYFVTIEEDVDRNKHATRAVFILTDAEDTSGTGGREIDDTIYVLSTSLKGSNESCNTAYDLQRIPEQNSIFKDAIMGPMIPKEMIYNLHYGKVRGDILPPPHGTNTSYSVISVKKIAFGNKQHTTECGFEIFTIGVGLNIDHFMLSQIASTPYLGHVFLINEMADLGRIAEIISEKNIDYGQCGISGNTEIAQDTKASETGAWPWIGWVNVYDTESPKTCGGYLVCQRYFVTTATCVTKDDGDGDGNYTVVNDNSLMVTLADHLLYKQDTNEIQVRVRDIHVHPSFTGETNIYGVKDYDIALLDFGDDKARLPVLSKHIRPICMAASTASAVYAGSSSRLIHLKQHWRNTHKKGFVVGWGHKTEPSVDLPIETIQQTRRTAHTNKRCKKVYPELDTDMFFCVGNFKESEDCRNSDIGGPFMDELANRQYAVLGMTLNTTHCDNSRDRAVHFSIFLNTLRKDIVTWLGTFLSECNRIEEIVPTSELKTDEANTDGADAEPNGGGDSQESNGL